MDATLQKTALLVGLLAKKREEWEDKTPVAWFTARGHHVPVFAGETREDAAKRYFDYHAKKAGMGVAEDLKKKYAPALQPDGNYDLAKLGEFAEEVEKKDKKTGEVTKSKVLTFNNQRIEVGDLISVRKPNGPAEYSIDFMMRRAGGEKKLKKNFLDYSSEYKQKQHEGTFQRIHANAEKHAQLGTLVNADLQHADEHQRQSALVVRLMNDTGARIGAKTDKKHRGISSLRVENLRDLPDGGMELKFTGKSGERLRYQVAPDLVPLLKKQREGKVPSDRIFNLSRNDVGEYLAQVTGSKMHPHDIRRYHASIRALGLIALMKPPQKGESYVELQKRLDKMYTKVAKFLGHKDAKPKLARTVYSDPDIERAWAEGRLEGLAQALHTAVQKAVDELPEEMEITPAQEKLLAQWLKRIYGESNRVFAFPDAGDDFDNFVDD